MWASFLFNFFGIYGIISKLFAVVHGWEGRALLHRYLGKTL